MKSTNVLLILITYSSVLFIFPCLAQEVHTITLFVNTSEIKKPNSDDSCNFGQEEGIANRDYTIHANIGDTIIWEGVSTNAPDSDEVQIVSINHEGGKNVFSENILKSDSNNPGRVVGIVVNGEEGDEDKYAISFTVMNNGRKRNGMFRIDPKIKIGN